MKAVVGGASSGLGAAIAGNLAEQGYDLLLWARDEERLKAVARRLTNVKVETVTADATDPGAAQKVADAAGQADILVLNAGGPPPAPADRTDADE